MARIYGLNGLIRGRQGNNVFSIQNGTQVLKAYNPSVANPRTIAQREQRTKFALAGKMSGIVPPLAIAGMPGSAARLRRASFVSHLINNMTVTGADLSLTASIPYEQIFFALGSLPVYSNVPTVTATKAGVSRVRVTATVNAMSFVGNQPAGYRELVICCMFDAATSALDEVQVGERSTASSTAFTFRLAAARDVRIATYVVPFSDANRTATFGTSGINGEEEVVSLDSLAKSYVAGVDWGESVFVSVIPVLGAQTSTAPAPSDENRFVSDPDTGEMMRKK